jgi:CubicO group peptidase (beta-lactamase class C family)
MMESKRSAALGQANACLCSADLSKFPVASKFHRTPVGSPVAASIRPLLRGLFFFLLLAGAAFAQEIASHEEGASLSEADQQSVDGIFAAYDKTDSPGCVLGVIRDGAFIYRKGYGMASLELGVPLSSQSVFYMGSVSKQFTAASVVLAVEQGYLGLDDNVRKYIPELPDYGHAVTLRQMLHHTSGFRDVLGLLDLSGRSALDLHPKAELIDLVARQKALNYDPGEEFLYSNTNYFLLAEVVSRATKRPFSQFAAENIFQPLGMSHTRFYDDHTLVVPGRVPAYDLGPNGGFLVDWSTNFDKVGDGGLMSSVDDLLLWDRNFYDNKLGKGTLIQEMQTRGVLNSGKQISYALGLEIGDYRGLATVEHGGALFGYRTEILRFPQERFSVVCLCNLANANPDRLAHEVADIVLKDKLQVADRALPPSSGGASSDPGPFAGKYLDPRTHSTITFTASSGNLLFAGEKLRRLASNKFEGPGGALVTFDSSGGPVKAIVSRGGEIILAGSKIDELHLDDTALAAYAGSYWSTELEATFRLAVENRSLMLRRNWNPPLRLDPLVHDEFESDELGTLVFQRDAAGRISGLSVFAGRIRNLVFKRLNKQAPVLAPVR